MSIYEEMDQVQTGRMKRDFILKMFHGDDIQKLNVELQYLIKTCLSLKNASDRLKKSLQMVLKNEDRSAKHALLTFAMYNDQTYRESLMSRGKVNVIKFQNFYDLSLKVETENLLNGRLICLQDYIEIVRHEYNMS
jgi:hypothetical protein|tara:strand:+ start:3036 stop:3443 length:408 start_codon:yes stop_codon:yes gene_type:complete